MENNVNIDENCKHENSKHFDTRVPEDTGISNTHFVKGYGGMTKISSPPISISSIDSGYTDNVVDSESIGTTYNATYNGDSTSSDLEQDLLESKNILEDKENRESGNENDEIPVWLKDGFDKNDIYECSEINTPDHSMASVIARQLQAAGNKKNSKRKGRSNKNNGRNSKVKTYPSFSN